MILPTVLKVMSGRVLVPLLAFAMTSCVVWYEIPDYGQSQYDRSSNFRAEMNESAE